MTGRVLHGMLLALLLASSLPVCAYESKAGQYTDSAELVVIHKSARTLSLISEGTIISRFPIKLGANPVGHKTEAGDSRTPEGRYFIEYKNPESSFFLSLKISYPSARDRAHARREGTRPGGNIMIHGMPNQPRYEASYYRHVDWTDGCIAVSNFAMQQIWQTVEKFTPVVIYP